MSEWPIESVGTIGEMLSARKYIVDGKTSIDLTVKINGEYTLLADYIDYLPAENDVVLVRILEGDPATASAVVVNAVSTFWAAASAYINSSLLLKTVGKALLSAAINGIVSHLTKPPKKADAGEARKTDSVYSFSGSQNSIATGQPEAFLHGTRKGFFPEIPLQDMLYVTYEDTDSAEGSALRKRSVQILNMLLFVGKHDCDVSNVTVGETKMEALTNSSYTVLPPNTDLTPFTPRIITAQEIGEIELKAPNEVDNLKTSWGANEGWSGIDDGYIVNPYGTEVDKLYFYFYFQLAKTSDGVNYTALTAEADVEIATVDKDGNLTSAWETIQTTGFTLNRTLAETPLTINVEKTLLGYGITNFVVQEKLTLPWSTNKQGEDVYNDSGRLTLSNSYYTITTDGIVDKITIHANAPVSALHKGWVISPYSYATDNLFDGVKHTGADATPYILRTETPVTAGRYATRFRRSDVKDLSSSAVHVCKLVGVAGRNTAGYDNSECTMVHVKLQAQDQLSGQSSTKIKMDAFYKDSNGALDNNVVSLIERLINSSDGVIDTDLVHADYDSLNALNTELISVGATANCRLTSQSRIDDFVESLLAEMKCAMFIKNQRLNFTKEKYPLVPYAVIPSRKIIKGSFSETINFPSDNRATAVIGHYYDNDERKPRKVKLIPDGYDGLIEAQIEVRFLDNIDDVISYLFYVANSSVRRLLPSKISIGGEGLDIPIGAHLEIAIPRITGTQSAETKNFDTVNNIVLLDITPDFDPLKTYSVRFLDNHNAPSTAVEITSFNGKEITLDSAPPITLNTRSDDGNSTRCVITAVGYTPERRLVKDIDVSVTPKGKVVCELSTVDDYEEVHDGRALVYVDESPFPITVDLLNNGINYNMFVPDISAVMDDIAGEIDITWTPYGGDILPEIASYKIKLRKWSPSNSYVDLEVIITNSPILNTFIPTSMDISDGNYSNFTIEISIIFTDPTVYNAPVSFNYINPSYINNENITWDKSVTVTEQTGGDVLYNWNDVLGVLPENRILTKWVIKLEAYHDNSSGIVDISYEDVASNVLSKVFNFGDPYPSGFNQYWVVSVEPKFSPLLNLGSSNLAYFNNPNYVPPPENYEANLAETHVTNGDGTHTFNVTFTPHPTWLDTSFHLYIVPEGPFGNANAYSMSYVDPANFTVDADTASITVTYARNISPTSYTTIDTLNIII